LQVQFDKPAHNNDSVLRYKREIVKRSLAHPVSLSVLDLIPVTDGSSVSDAFSRAVQLARLAERMRFARYWVAEHHATQGLASAAPEVVIAHVASHTASIRVGSGGIMLLNHAPLRVAETFRTLEALYPDRIDLGIGRAVGGNETVARALRTSPPEVFPEHLLELISLCDDRPGGNIVSTPTSPMPFSGNAPPMWILGASGSSATLAGTLGLGYAFGAHFSATSPAKAVREYREHFRRSARFAAPHVIVAISAICAPTDEEAQWHASSMGLAAVRLRRGENPLLPAPKEAVTFDYSAQDRVIVEETRRPMLIGSAQSVHMQICALIDATKADEIMITSLMFSHQARLRSYRLIAEAFARAPIRATRRRRSRRS
jgi:luciferase family oxidoreductase group 1